MDGDTPSWFLLALFGARLFFAFIVKYSPHHYLLISVLLSTASLLLTILFSFSTFLSLTSATGSLVFVTVGYYAKSHNLISRAQTSPYKVTFALLAMLLWLNTSLFGEVDVHLNVYKLWVVDYLGAIGGTYFFFVISQFIEQNIPVVRNLLEKAGYYSLVILSFHAIEFNFPSWYQVVFFLHPSLVRPALLACRIAISFVSVILTLKVKPLKTLFFVSPSYKS